MKASHRKLMEEYVEDLGGKHKATLEAASKYYEPVIDSKRALMTIKTPTALFNRLSKNALQNVMEFFDYKGTDFVKMRCINQKTKNAYM